MLLVLHVISVSTPYYGSIVESIYCPVTVLILIIHSWEKWEIDDERDWLYFYLVIAILGMELE